MASIATRAKIAAQDRILELLKAEAERLKSDADAAAAFEREAARIRKLFQA